MGSRKPKVCLLSRFLPCSGRFAKQSVTITTRRRGSRGRIDNSRAQIAALMQGNAFSLKNVHFSTKCIFDGARRTSCQWLRSTGACSGRQQRRQRSLLRKQRGEACSDDERIQWHLQP